MNHSRYQFSKLFTGSPLKKKKYIFYPSRCNPVLIGLHFSMTSNLVFRKAKMFPMTSDTAMLYHGKSARVQ